MRHNRALTRWNIIGFTVLLFAVLLAGGQAYAQGYNWDAYYQNQEAYAAGAENNAQVHPPVPARHHGRRPAGQAFPPRLQYDQRDAEMILRDQVSRNISQRQPAQVAPDANAGVYDNYAYGHRINDEGHVRVVMAEARRVGSFIAPKRNGKTFVVIDKRNFQFYLYDAHCNLLRIGPVAIGKGTTEVGAFETPVGIFPVKSKVPVDDWIRPDWYFVEEGEPIPQRWEDRRVPGFFRYKVVFDGTRYIHYAEATGGRLTHGCLGLDWEDAEAVFHTLQVGSYCIIIDGPFASRLARGEFQVRKPPEAKAEAKADAKSDVRAEARAESKAEPRSEAKPEVRAEVKRPEPLPRTGPVAAKADSPEDGEPEQIFRNMW
jgi:lipoprotein-anchoring transpeptidase ErfK/SrfK